MIQQRLLQTFNTQIMFLEIIIPIGSAFTETVSHAGNAEDPGYYKQTVYVNPSEKSLTNAKLKSWKLIIRIILTM